jgi:DEAD/DEAH box helicase domain-containing protein
MTPPQTVQGFASKSANNELIAFAQKEKSKYSTAALSITTFTIVKYLGRLELSKDISSALSGVETTKPTFLAGHGVVNVKKQVHGYKKLSLVDRSEISRHEIRLPPMEYDTNSLWIDVDSTELRKEIKSFDEGVHALSHALVALAPVFVNCSYSDIDCDHTHFGCTRILLYDTRAGGSETSARLWDNLFGSEGLIESAIDILSSCPSRCDGSGHVCGCPACIQAVPCSDFQNGLSKTAAIAIAEHILHRFKQGCHKESAVGGHSDSFDESTTSPRRKKRMVALNDATDLERARERSILIGRQSWPTDE